MDTYDNVNSAQEDAFTLKHYQIKAVRYIKYDQHDDLRILAGRSADGTASIDGDMYPRLVGDLRAVGHGEPAVGILEPAAVPTAERPPAGGDDGGGGARLGSRIVVLAPAVVTIIAGSDCDRQEMTEHIAGMRTEIR